ncbi:unnamed protein product [Darwinula stevensoni]|uniref:Regulatory protein zeste n=1 Tax=Darwinula stevensoni TaxID=69355 RepID=A0A7R8XE57_9CRUS|nr:unnamed protein product [Darwinula stevensoni]CAG0894158.1 unnamed protein product [Darwinula stevensoni]
MPRASQRVKAFSEDECNVLVEEVGKTAGKPLVSITDSSPRTIQRKAWEAVADSMANVTSIRRTGEEIQEKFKRMLQSAEKRQKNGEPLSSRETRVLELCGSAKQDTIPAGDPGSSSEQPSCSSAAGGNRRDGEDGNPPESSGEGRRGRKRRASPHPPDDSDAKSRNGEVPQETKLLMQMLKIQRAILRETRRISSSLANREDEHSDSADTEEVHFC